MQGRNHVAVKEGEQSARKDGTPILRHERTLRAEDADHVRAHIVLLGDPQTGRLDPSLYDEGAPDLLALCDLPPHAGAIVTAFHAAISMHWFAVRVVLGCREHGGQRVLGDHLARFFFNLSGREGMREPVKGADRHDQALARHGFPRGRHHLGNVVAVPVQRHLVDDARLRIDELMLQLPPPIFGARHVVHLADGALQPMRLEHAGARIALRDQHQAFRRLQQEPVGRRLVLGDPARPRGNVQEIVLHVLITAGAGQTLGFFGYRRDRRDLVVQVQRRQAAETAGIALCCGIRPQAAHQLAQSNRLFLVPTQNARDLDSAPQMARNFEPVHADV